MADDYDYCSGSDSESYTDTDDAAPDPRAGGDRTAANRPRYVVLTPREIHRRLSKEAAATAEVFSVPTDWALALLVHYRWNPMRLQEDWFAGEQDSIRAAAGLGDDLPAGPEDEEAMSCCGICTEAKPAAEMASAGCAHRYCHGCWRGYVAAALEGGGAGCLALRCPDASCPRAVLRGTVERFATVDGRRAYARQLARAYVEARRLWLTPCTAPRCGCAIEVSSRDTDSSVDGDVRCRCGGAFCRRCGGAAHWPASCADLAQWARSADAASADWIALHTKRCPQCRRPIERAEGCRRMICAEPCNHFFCWVCLGPTAVGTWGDHDACWDSDGGDEEHSPEQARAKEALGRFLHYQNLWMGNLSNQRNAEAELRRVRDKKLPRERRAVARGYLASVAAAWEQVAEGRRVLGNACAHGQRLREADAARWELFEFQHRQADAVLQRLQHRAMEAPATEVWRMEELGAELESLTRVTRRCVDNFVKAMQEGLQLHAAAVQQQD